MDGIIKATFRGSEYTQAEKSIDQWDKGQRLEITGLNIEGDIEVHFSLDQTHGTAKRVPAEVVEDVIYANVPAFIHEHAGVSYAFVYQSKGDISETIGKILLKVKERPKPDDYVEEGDIPTWKQLESRIKELEENGVPEERIQEAVEAYLKDNNIEANVYMRVSEGYIQYSTDNEVWNDVIAVSDLKGNTPQKGVDYFTEADKKEMVDSVLNALPTWKGGAY